MPTTYSQRIREWISIGLNVVLLNGRRNEMLSSRAYREGGSLERWLDWMFGAGHCKAAYEWEKEHYDVERYK